MCVGFSILTYLIPGGEFERRAVMVMGRERRNDQVATDFRLWMLDSLPLLDEAIQGFQSVLLDLAETHQTTLMPGYTHLQRAQPVTFSHWLLSHFWSLQRDRERLQDLRDRVAVCPLGSGALAGTAFPIDREALAQTSRL